MTPRRATRTVRVIGPGRAGFAFAGGLGGAGWDVDGPLGRDADLTGAALGVDLVLIATGDPAVEAVAGAIAPRPSTTVAHVAGALGLDVLRAHPHRASIHPLMAIPPAPLGAQRLTSGAWFAIASSSAEARSTAHDVVTALGGREVEVDDSQRVGYHAAACIASNHLVALLGQVERVSASAGVPLEAYLDLVRATVENVAELGPAGALTGPAARGDWATVARHLEALDPSERPAYQALAAQARRLVDPAFDAASGLPLPGSPRP